MLSWRSIFLGNLPPGFFRNAAFSACIVFGVLMNLSYYGKLSNWSANR